jgi:type VI secretion system protein ImpH
MAAEGRMESAALGLDALERALREDSTSFGFFQAVRLLERLHPERARVGGFGDPADEVVRFSVPAAIAFPPSEIAELSLAEDAPSRMSVNFMGLTGPSGVLPLQYTSLASERKRARDDAYASFLDIFHHRIISLFYRAWAKHRFTVGVEQGDDRLRDHVLDLIGAGLGASRAHLPIGSDALVRYAGLFVLQSRSALALTQLIEDYFDVPAQIEQFVGAWYPLPEADQCALGEELDVSTQLGTGAVIGDEVWDQQTRARIRIGPLSRARLGEFLPDGDAFATLREVTRFFSHDQYEFELQLVLARDEVPGLVLGADDDDAQPLGWSTWVRTRPPATDADDILLRL